MKIREIVDALERFAPLPLQDDYDNSGLQIGTTETEVSRALLCLDVTSQVVDEAIEKGCGLIISHHPLLFRPLKCLTDDYIGSIVMKAVRAGITVYACHTNLDNTQDGVSKRVAQTLGLTQIELLDRHNDGGGAGVIGSFAVPIEEQELLCMVKERFGTACIRHNGPLGHKISRMAVCGGAGAFLIDRAVEQGAQAFMTGEIGYHRFFGYDGKIKLIETGHFESEQFTVELIADILCNSCPELQPIKSSHKTNPIEYWI